MEESSGVATLRLLPDSKDPTVTSVLDAHRGAWLDRIALAESAIPLIGRLHRDRDVVPHVHGRKLVNRSAPHLLRALNPRQAAAFSVDVADAVRVLELALEQDLRSVSLDLGAVLAEAPADPGARDAHVRAHLAALDAWPSQEPTDVVLYGFGRIGRLVARILVGHASGTGVRLRAIVVRPSNVPNDLEKRASLLRTDSVHGAFDGEISIDAEANTILANGTLIQVISADDPSAIDYTAFGIRDALLVDNTGRWRDEEGLRRHLASPGIGRVVLTAPGKSPLKNVVFGINHHVIEPGDEIITAASCTTNAITPVLKVLDDAFGIRHGHVETVHSYTNDQNLIDNFHKGERRGRAAALNMVITETGAATAVAKALPQLAGKLTGNAIRVPTPDVSLAILNLDLGGEVDVATVNGVLRAAAVSGELRSQIGYVESSEVVSTDFVGSNRAGVVDGLATIASGTHAVVYVWYDNEYGYSSQVVRVLEHMAQVRA